MSQTENPGRSRYATYIKEQLDAQEARKASIEQRGLAVITTAGALVTLLFGLTGLSTQRAATFDIPGAAATFLTVALVFFVLAALSAIFTNLPRSYKGSVTVDALRDAVKNRWDDTDAEAARMVALTQLKALASAKDVNTQKGYFLVAGMLFEIVAVALVGVAMGIVVWD